jgi:hypothetical protein
MKTTLAKVASALSFAHLSGLGRSSAAKAEEDDDKKDRDHEDGNVKKGKGKAEDDNPDEDDKDKDASAEDDDPDASAEADDDKRDDDKKDGKAKGKKAEDDDDEKMAAGAREERARCGAIFASPAAAANVGLAAELAFKTDLSAKQAIAVLEKAPAASRGASPQRSARNPALGAGGSTQTSTDQAVATRWDAAFKKANPRAR